MQATEDSFRILQTHWRRTTCCFSQLQNQDGQSYTWYHAYEGFHLKSFRGCSECFCRQSPTEDGRHLFGQGRSRCACQQLLHARHNAIIIVPYLFSTRCPRHSLHSCLVRLHTLTNTPLFMRPSNEGAENRQQSSHWKTLGN